MRADSMRLSWAIVGGAAIGVGLWWWTTREARQSDREHERRAAARAEAARPVLYRWRDADGVLQVTEQPPRGTDAGRRYERIGREPYGGIEIHGDRGGAPPSEDND